ncbi:MAG TPA: ABC transporter ATP-binding protein [Chloroflexota bacterium]|nr:ABC transporter ATP-binding protein [Chloroflexota bacterium]
MAVGDSTLTEPAPPAQSERNPAMVQLRSVTKRFDDVVAVNNLSLDIGRGEFFSLLGPSGCGKTTTLRMIGGFETPTVGAIMLDGRVVNDIPPYRRDVNTVFQSYALFPHLNVFDNLAFGLRQRKIDKRETRGLVKAALDMVNLGGMEKRKPSQLSGGQQQRVALARALINRPKVLLLDEPLGALDARLRKQMQLELKGIQQEVGITFVYVTHDQEEALTMSDRLAVMHDGVIEQIDTPQAVYDHPSTEFVANFLGASNLLDAVPIDRPGRRVRLESGEIIQLPVELPPGDSVRVGVRPEKIQTVPAGSPGAAGMNTVAATVRTATFVGVSYQYTVLGPAGDVMTVYAQNQGVERIPEPGERVELRWLPEHTFVVT